MTNLEHQLIELIETSRVHQEDILPSVWYEQNMVMPKGSAMPGPASFKHTPFLREPLDCMSDLHPAKEVTLMKGAQVGGTAFMLMPAVGYIIAKDPGHIMFLTGHSKLSKGAMKKIDHMIDNCGLRGLIGADILRKKNARSGDTSEEKEFVNGFLKAGSVTNHNLLRQEDIRFMFVDDFDAAKASGKETGSTRQLVQGRTKAFGHNRKIYWVSSPQVQGKSNIEDVFNLGDKRYYMVPCPCCGEFIDLQWSVEIDGTDGKEKGGIYWKNDSKGRIDRSSVGYICQKCGDFFDDSQKYEMNLAGHWHPTVEAAEEDHYSYHINSLYAPPFMFNWATYAQQYMTANPVNAKRKEAEHQTFMNLALGLTYKQVGKSIKANALQKNTRNYEIRTVPDKMSVEDGNGKIVLLTCACDLGGYPNDARLDFEVVGWSENMSSYSIIHGSIGTFIPNEGKEKVKVDREKWTYELGHSKSVWPEFEKVLDTTFTTDSGRNMKVIISGVDTGYFTKLAYKFIDHSNHMLLALKGGKKEDFTGIRLDQPTFKEGKERSDLYIVDGNIIKDQIYDNIELKWDPKIEPKQPQGFMNFPIPSGGLYLYNNFFSHYEAEHRVYDEKDGKESAWMWKKKTNTSQNHLWDCHVYNHAIRDLWIYLLGKQMKIKGFKWVDFVKTVVKE